MTKCEACQANEAAAVACEANKQPIECRGDKIKHEFANAVRDECADTIRALRADCKCQRQEVDKDHRICEHGRDAWADDCGMCDAAGTNWALAAAKEPK